MHSQVEHVWSVRGYTCVCEHVCVAVCYQKLLPEIQNIYFLFIKFPEGEVSGLLLKSQGVYSEMSYSHEIGAYQRPLRPVLDDTFHHHHGEGCDLIVKVCGNGNRLCGILRTFQEAGTRNKDERCAQTPSPTQLSTLLKMLLYFLNN